MSFPAWRAWDSTTRNAKSPTPLTSLTLSILTANTGHVFCISSLGDLTSTGHSSRRWGTACWTCWELRAALSEMAKCFSTMIWPASSFMPELKCWGCGSDAWLMHCVVLIYGVLNFIKVYCCATRHFVLSLFVIVAITVALLSSRFL